MNDYRVIEREGCTLIYGAAPMDSFLHISSRQPEGAVLDPNLARMAGANFAMGRPEDLTRLRSQLRPEALEKTRRCYAAANLSEEVIRWLAIGEQGRSSLSMAQRLLGIAVPGSSLNDIHHPHDTDDLRRCRLLLEQCPELQPHLVKMAGASEVWARLVGEWDALCALMDEESPEWRTGGGRASRTYERMKALGC